MLCTVAPRKNCCSFCFTCFVWRELQHRLTVNQRRWLAGLWNGLEIPLPVYCSCVRALPFCHFFSGCGRGGKCNLDSLRPLWRKQQIVERVTHTIMRCVGQWGSLYLHLLLYRHIPWCDGAPRNLGRGCNPDSFLFQRKFEQCVGQKLSILEKWRRSCLNYASLLLVRKSTLFSKFNLIT